MRSACLARTLSKEAGVHLKGCASVPVIDEGDDLLFEVGEVVEVRCHQALALKNREPLLDLIHPGAVDGCEMHRESRVRCEPRARELAAMDADVVADEVDLRDVRWRFGVDLLEEFQEFQLSFSSAQNPKDFARTSVEGRKEVERPFPHVFVLEAHRDLIHSGGLGWRRSGPRLERGLFVEGQHPCDARENCGAAPFWWTPGLCSPVHPD